MSRPFLTGFLIFPGFPMACLTSMIEPLRAANEISGQEAFLWRLVAVTREKVRSSASIDFEPDQTIAEATDLDLLMVLSAPTARFQTSADAAKLRAMQRHGTVLGAVSGGVFPLVHAGIGADKPLAVHWCYKAAFEADFPGHVSSDRVIELSEDIVTAAGAAAAFDLSLHLIEQRLGPDISTEVACWFQHPVMRREGVGQAVPALSGNKAGEQLAPLVARAAKLFAEHISDPMSFADVAARLGITPRHLERSFKQSTGLNPTQYYRKMRMDAARQMILYTNDRLGDIGAAVGYSSAQTFAKHYRAAFGVTPREDRNRINLFRVKGNLSIPSA
ncbi:GlxA family transcriptional regulator [Primorskyibacter sp. S187A]|uniref:GlxA family transcriptional regulator n=1 Tax=Primorskyibacter sp. S187A TaxID=3415130 RepID=UPI003C7B9417